jgi:hypothetical protein
MDLSYEPEFIMQDACAASRLAVLKFFPDINILMCYFHLKKNIKDNCKKLLDKDQYKELQVDIKKIHMSHKNDDYENNKKEFKKKWKKINVEVYDYCATWFEGEWSTWQIFRNKPGQANTNSNIESFNNTIKLDLSRKRLPMKAAINAIFEQIVYYSTEYEPFAKIPKYNQKTRELADCLIKSNFRVVRPNKKIVYTGPFKGKESKYTLSLNDDNYLNRCNCSCKYFLKHAICMHLLAYSNFNNLELFGARYAKPITANNFVTKNKRGPKTGNQKYGKALDKPEKTTKAVTKATKQSVKPKKK